MITYDDEIASTSSSMEGRADGVAFGPLVSPLGVEPTVPVDGLVLGGDGDGLPTPSLDRERRPTSTTGTRLESLGLGFCVVGESPDP